MEQIKKKLLQPRDHVDLVEHVKLYKGFGVEMAVGLWKVHLVK